MASPEADSAVDEGHVPEELPSGSDLVVGVPSPSIQGGTALRANMPTRQARPCSTQVLDDPHRTIDVSALLSKITILGDRARIVEAIACVNFPTRYEEALAQYAQRKAVDPSLPYPPPRGRASGFAGDDVNQLLEHDIVEPIEIEHIKANGKMFAVGELDKDSPSRRAICWTRLRLQTGHRLLTRDRAGGGSGQANVVQERVFGSRGGARGPKPVVHFDNVRFLANTRRGARFYAEQWARLCKEISAQGRGAR